MFAFLQQHSLAQGNRDTQIHTHTHTHTHTHSHSIGWVDSWATQGGAINKSSQEFKAVCEGGFRIMEPKLDQGKNSDTRKVIDRFRINGLEVLEE